MSVRKRDMELIEATTRHIPAIVSLWNEIMEYHREIDPIFRKSARGQQAYRDFITRLLKSKHARVLMVRDGRRFIAFSTAVIVDRPPVFERAVIGQVFDFYVRPAYRRRGAGRHMLARLEAWFLEKGIDRVELSVSSGNSLGHAFWRTQGFQEYLHTLYLEMGGSG